MKFRGLLTTIAAATLCCFTLGCPPAEDGSVPAEINVTEGAGDNTTAEGSEVEEPAAADEAPADEAPAEEAPAEEAPAPAEETPAGE